MIMIERVAQAIAIELDNSENISGDTQFSREAYRGLARAAITAMREPTEAMVGAGWISIVPETDGEHVARCVWGGMIDAALQE